MVQLSLLATKGAVARYFPHSGFLALTPVVLEGSVRTRLDDDGKLLHAKDLFVALRCYEARLSRTGVQHSNLLVDHRLQLWEKPPHLPYADLGDGDFPFRLVLPAHQAGHSTAHLQEYRVFWRVEAVLNHVPMVGLGHCRVKTYDLPLMRYDPGEGLPPAGPAWAHALATKLPAAPSFRYRINAPPFPLGPLDLVPVSLKIVPSDPQVRVVALALAVERRLEFNDLARGGGGGDDDDGGGKRRDDASTTNLLPGGTRKTITFLVASADATDVPRDDRGVYAKTVTLQIPTPKSSSHWAVGETMRTALVTLRFFLHVKVTLAHGPSGTAETVELAARELYLVATNEAQRRVAMESVERARASKHAASAAAAESKAKSGRRPHTSSGLPRARRERERERTRHTASSPEAGDERSHRLSASAGGSPTTAAGARGMFGAAAAGEGGEYAPLPVPVPVQSAPLAAEWEEELERIAAQSRRRSVEMLSGDGSLRRTRARVDAGC